MVGEPSGDPRESPCPERCAASQRTLQHISSASQAGPFPPPADPQRVLKHKGGTDDDRNATRCFGRRRHRRRRAHWAAAHAELAKAERQIRNIVEAVKVGMFAPAMKDELAALEARMARLAEATGGQDAEPPMLHPGLADVYRRMVEKLTQAFNEDQLRAEAAETLRSMIQAIQAHPAGRGDRDRVRGRNRRDFGVDQRKPPPAGRRGGGQVTLLRGRATSES